MAGQILNDVKDLVSTNLYGRKSFSDIRGGIMTIPLVMLYKGLNEEQKRYFCSIFGHRDLTNNELENFHEIVYTKLPRFEIFERVRTGYSHFLELMGRIDSIDGLNLSERWVSYKMAQAQELLFLSNNE